MGAATMQRSHDLVESTLAEIYGRLCEIGRRAPPGELTKEAADDWNSPTADLDGSPDEHRSDPQRSTASKAA